jgi:hypothetical protein
LPSDTEDPKASGTGRDPVEVTAPNVGLNTSETDDAVGVTTDVEMSPPAMSAEPFGRSDTFAP